MKRVRPLPRIPVASPQPPPPPATLNLFSVISLCLSKEKCYRYNVIEPIPDVL